MVKQRMSAASVLVFLGLVFGACTDGPTDAFDPSFKPGNGGGGGGGGGKGGGGSSGTPLAVGFRDDVGDPVQSDRSGLYVHDDQDVRALFGDNADFPGQFQFTTDTDEKNAVGRELSIDLPGVFTGSVIGRMLAPGVFLDLMSAGDTHTTRLKVSWEADGFRYTLRYGSDCGGANPRDDGIVVTLTYDNPRTYVVTDLNDAIVCIQALKGKPSSDIVGPLTVPLQMTITEVGGQSP